MASTEKLYRPMKSHINGLAKRRILYPLRKAGLFISKNWPFPVQATLSNGGYMYVDLRSSIGRAILVKGEFDHEVWRIIEASLQPGSVFIDVGANVGYYSMLASSSVGVSGVVHAFEIDPRPLQCLSRNVLACPNQNLHINKIAVGNFVGDAILLSEEDCGHSSVKTEGKGVKVAILTLDHWLETSVNLERVDVLKLDIEGGELSALEGAIKLIDKYRPLIVCEALDPSTRKNVPGQDKLLSFFSEINYSTSMAEGVHSPTIVAAPN